MLVLGCYFWFANRTAFRNDYCLPCKSVTTSECVRSLHVLHAYFVPFFPLGFWNQWYCRTCGLRPHVATKTGTGLKWAAVAALMVGGIACWLEEIKPGPDAAFMWGMRIAPLVLIPVIMLWIQRDQGELSLKQGLSSVERYNGETCLLCGDSMSDGSPRTCIKCAAKHVPLNDRNENIYAPREAA